MAKFFSKESYHAFLDDKHSSHNQRLRDDNTTIFDVAATAQADFTQSAEGREFFEFLKSRI
jgi:hypothetical protein